MMDGFMKETTPVYTGVIEKSLQRGGYDVQRIVRDKGSMAKLRDILLLRINAINQDEFLQIIMQENIILPVNDMKISSELADNSGFYKRIGFDCKEISADSKIRAEFKKAYEERIIFIPESLSSHDKVCQVIGIMAEYQIPVEIDKIKERFERGGISETDFNENYKDLPYLQDIHRATIKGVCDQNSGFYNPNLFTRKIIEDAKNKVEAELTKEEGKEEGTYAGKVSSRRAQQKQCCVSM